MSCRDCVSFINEPGRIEMMIPGLAVLGSARASVWANDGICTEHDIMVGANDCCDRFAPRSMPDRRG
jgi:hypothetical protein